MFSRQGAWPVTHDCVNRQTDGPTWPEGLERAPSASRRHRWAAICTHRRAAPRALCSGEPHDDRAAGAKRVCRNERPTQAHHDPAAGAHSADVAQFRDGWSSSAMRVPYGALICSNTLTRPERLPWLFFYSGVRRVLHAGQCIIPAIERPPACGVGHCADRDVLANFPTLSRKLGTSGLVPMGHTSFATRLNHMPTSSIIRAGVRQGERHAR
jgi:hypothetical protein